MADGDQSTETSPEQHARVEQRQILALLLGVVEAMRKGVTWIPLRLVGMAAALAGAIGFRGGNDNKPS